MGIFLIFNNNGTLRNSTWNAQEAMQQAQQVKGGYAEVPIIEDFRPTMADVVGGDSPEYR